MFQLVIWYSYNEWLLYARHIVRAWWRASDEGRTTAHRCLGKYGLEVDRDADKSFQILHVWFLHKPSQILLNFHWQCLSWNIFLVNWRTRNLANFRRIVLGVLSDSWNAWKTSEIRNFHHFSTDLVLRPSRFCWEHSQHDSILLFLWYSSLF